MNRQDKSIQTRRKRKKVDKPEGWSIHQFSRHLKHGGEEFPTPIVQISGYVELNHHVCIQHPPGPDFEFNLVNP